MDQLTIDECMKLPFQVGKGRHEYHYKLEFMRNDNEYVIDMPNISHKKMLLKLSEYAPILLKILNNNVYIMGPLVCELIHKDVLSYKIADIFILKQFDLEFANIISTIGNAAAISLNHDTLIIRTKEFTYNIYLRYYKSQLDMIHSSEIDNYSVAMNLYNTWLSKNAAIAHMFRIIPLHKNNKSHINDVIYLINAGFTVNLISNDAELDINNYINFPSIKVNGHKKYDINISNFKTNKGGFICYSKNGVGVDYRHIFKYELSTIIPSKSMPININIMTEPLTSCAHCGIEDLDYYYYEYSNYRICLHCLKVYGNTLRTYHKCNFTGRLHVACGDDIEPNDKNGSMFYRYFNKDLQFSCKCGLFLTF